MDKSIAEVCERTDEVSEHIEVGDQKDNVSATNVEKSEEVPSVNEKISDGFSFNGHSMKDDPCMLVTNLK